MHLVPLEWPKAASGGTPPPAPPRSRTTSGEGHRGRSKMRTPALRAGGSATTPGPPRGDILTGQRLKGVQAGEVRICGRGLVGVPARLRRPLQSHRAPLPRRPIRNALLPGLYRPYD